MTTQWFIDPGKWKKWTTNLLEGGERKPPPGHDQSEAIGMPITLVAPGMAAGGAERQTVDLAVGLKQLGFAPVVVSTGAQHQPDHPEFLAKLAAAGVPYGVRHPNDEILPTLERGKVTIWWGAALLRLVKDCKEIPGSMYVAHGSTDTAAGLVEECRPGIRAAVGVCGPSARMLDRVLGIKGTPTVWNGIEPTEIPHVWNPRAVAGQPFTLGYLGRYAPEKNLDVAIHALSMLDDRFRLRLWGWGEGKPALARLTAELGVDDRVDLCGKPRNRREAFEGLDAVFLCSEGEGFPLVLIEAAMAGVPVITPPHGDLGYTFEHNRRGLIIEPNAPDLAMAALAYADSPDLAWRVSVEACRFAREILTADRMAAEYADLIQQVAN